MTPPSPAPDEALDGGWRERLRGLPVFPASMPEFDPDAAPQSPLSLASAWLEQAIEAGVLQPHAAVLSTVDEGARPSSRVLILKDLTPEGFWFATPSDSPKGIDLARNPHAALHFYWAELGRQLRVTGRVEAGPAAVSAADWQARSPAARAEADPATWTAYLLRPRELEFFAASAARSHTRLRYRLGDDADWTRERVAP